jgi:hypothetical protein
MDSLIWPENSKVWSRTLTFLTIRPAVAEFPNCGATKVTEVRLHTLRPDLLKKSLIKPSRSQLFSLRPPQPRRPSRHMVPRNLLTAKPHREPRTVRLLQEKKQSVDGKLE